VEHDDPEVRREMLEVLFCAGNSPIRSPPHAAHIHAGTSTRAHLQGCDTRSIGIPSGRIYIATLCESSTSVFEHF